VGVSVSYTRTETGQHAWECAHCRAHGVVTLRTVGESGWKRVWISERRAEQRAMNDAIVDVQRDAERILGMIRCPKCKERAPRARFWTGVRLVPSVIGGMLFGGLVGGGVLMVLGVTWWFGLAGVPLGGWIGSFPERRRWREANLAVVHQLEGGEAVVAKPAALPAPKLEPLRTAAPEQVERAADGEGPRFLK
jgi:hypothetical protein